jgi:two-component system chemotaxis response regulator CheY
MAEDYLSNIKFLIVEDNAFMTVVLRGVLRALGCRNTVIASDGAQALKMMRLANPDIVITDWEMQPIDGVEFAKMVRTASDSTNPLVPIIMLSGHSEARRVLAARDAGINEFVVKPVSASNLLSRIQSVIERPRPFIKTKTFFGPDRRRKQLPYAGPDRRAGGAIDAAKPPLASTT